MSDRVFKLCVHVIYAVLMMICVLSDDVMNKLNAIALFLYVRVTLIDGDD